MTTVDTKAISQELKRDTSLATSAIKRFSSDQCASLAASIAFYSAFSLAPTLLMVIAVAGFFFGADAARGQLFAQVHSFLGDEPAAAIQAIVENAHRGGGGGFAALMSVILLIVGASATFSSLNTALDVVFPAVPAERRSGIALMLRVRLVSFGLVLGVAFLLIVSLVLDTAVTFVGKMLWGDSPFVIVGDIVQMVISLGILSLAFTALMKLLPDARVEWRHALVGGIVSAVLFTIGKKLFALYLAHAGTASAFGAAGSLAVLLMWLYFSSAVLLLGAEFAAVKGGFGARKDLAAAAVASVRAEETLDASGALKVNVGGHGTHDERGIAGLTLSRMVPAALRQSAPLRSEPASASRASEASQASAASHSSASAAVDDTDSRAARRTGGMSTVATPTTARSATAASAVATRRSPIIDALLGGSRSPLGLRIALKSVPVALQLISMLLPAKGSRKPVALSRKRPRKDSEPDALEKKTGSDSRLTGRRDEPRTGVVGRRPRHPLTATVLAAGAGLIIASLANRPGRKDSGSS